MKIDKKIVRMGKMKADEDDGFINATMRQRIEMVWDITVSLWAVSTKGKVHAESRLQRDVAVFRRGAS